MELFQWFSSGDADVEREQHIYRAAGEKTDLLFNHHIVRSPTNIVAVELKCQSLGNANSFVAGLAQDLHKLEWSTTEATKRYTRMVIGLYVANEMKIWPGFSQNMWVDETGEVGVCYYLLAPS